MKTYYKSVALVAIATLGLLGVSPAAADDVTDAVRYGSDGRVIGAIAEDIQDEDDDAQLIRAPWAMNFFGRTYDGLCVTSNGTISPVVYDEAECSDDYDSTLAELAEYANAPVIAAFSNDNDLGNTVLDPEQTVSTFRVALDPQSSTATVTVTTSSAHGLVDGDVRSVYVVGPAFDNANDGDWRTDEYWFDDVTVDVSSSTSFSFSGLEAQGYDGDTYLPNYPAAVTASAVAVASGWVWDNDSDDLNASDDGVGVVNTVYIGETTVGGRDAWVYTNYRSVTYEDDNPRILTNTFQIVLVKRATVNGDTRGYDFDIEYNYGSMRDGGDGYDGEQLNCDAMTAGCRTGVGLVDWDPISNTADVYELFGSTPSRDLVDGLPSAMTNNRLNSELNGRYTFAMVGGAVQNFATPVMDGTGATSARPVTPTPTDPVAAESGQGLGESSLLVGGVPTEVTVTRNQDTNFVLISDGDFVLNLAGRDSDGGNLPLDSDGNLVVNQSGLVLVAGSGFTPNAPVKVYAFSEAVYVGLVYTDADGNFSGELTMPAGLEAGVHNLQVIGYDSDGVVRVMTIAIRILESGDAVVEDGGTLTPASEAGTLAETGSQSPAPLIGLALLAMVAGIVLTRRSVMKAETV